MVFRYKEKRWQILEDFPGQFCKIGVDRYILDFDWQKWIHWLIIIYLHEFYQQTLVLIELCHNFDYKKIRYKFLFRN